MHGIKIVSGLGLMTLLVLTGCATDIPLAKNPPLYTQQKIQAVDHWDNIANDVANRVQKTLEDRPDLTAIPIYIKPSNNRAFSLAFYNLLRTRIVSKGMQLSENPEASNLMLEYNVQTVLHDSPRGSSIPSLAGLGVGIVGAVTGGYTTTSNHEVIINSSMIYHNRYVMHLSHVAYINDDDWAMYLSPDSMDPMADKNRTVRIVNK